VLAATGYDDHALELAATNVQFVVTIERIHKQVPGAPVLPKPVYRDQLAKALAEVVETHH